MPTPFAFIRAAILVEELERVGGMERSTRALAEDLARQGARVFLLTTFQSETSGLVPRTERLGRLTIVRFPWPARWHYTLAELSFYARATCWLLAHAQSWHTIQGVYAPTCGALAALIGLLLRRRSIVRPACAGPPGDMVKIERHPARRFLLSLLECASVIACPGTEIAAEVNAAAPRANTRITPNGVDTARFHPKPHEFAHHVIAVMRFRPEKRVPRLLEAWALVEHANPKARLTIVGDGPERRRAEETARSLGVTRATFLGLRSDVPELLGAADVFVHASDNEGLSNALLEAMSSGLACVATDISPNREALGDAGVLVQTRAEAIAEGLLSVLGDASRARDLGQRARSRAIEHFSIERMVARYAALHLPHD